MPKPPKDTETLLNTIFAKERKQCITDEARVGQVMQKIHQEIGLRDLTLLVFVRFWLVLLHMGAMFYVASSRPKKSAIAQTTSDQQHQR